MVKLVFLIVLVIGLIALIYFKIPQVLYSKFFANTGKGFNFNLSLKSSEDQNADPIPKVKKNIEEKSKETIDNSINNIKDSIYQTAEKTLQNVFKKQSFSTNEQSHVPDGTRQSSSSNKTSDSGENNLKVEIVDKSQIEGVNASLTVIDLESDNNLKLTYYKNTKSFLQFKNTQANFCLYINGNKYPIDDNKLVSIELKSSGTYPIKTNFCDLNDKNLGIVIVN